VARLMSISSDFLSCHYTLTTSETEDDICEPTQQQNHTVGPNHNHISQW